MISQRINAVIRYLVGGNRVIWLAILFAAVVFVVHVTSFAKRLNHCEQLDGVLVRNTSGREICIRKDAVIE